MHYFTHHQNTYLLRFFSRLLISAQPTTNITSSVYRLHMQACTRFFWLIYRRYARVKQVSIPARPYLSISLTKTLQKGAENRLLNVALDVLAKGLWASLEWDTKNRADYACSLFYPVQRSYKSPSHFIQINPSSHLLHLFLRIYLGGIHLLGC